MHTEVVQPEMHIHIDFHKIQAVNVKYTNARKNVLKKYFLKHLEKGKPAATG